MMMVVVMPLAINDDNVLPPLLCSVATYEQLFYAAPSPSQRPSPLTAR
jgi:hypothetical protein